MRQNRIVIFLAGLILGLAAGGAGVAFAGGCPEVTITEEVLEAFCEGRQAHVCPDPCPQVPECPSPCPSPCEPLGDDCHGPPEIRVVPAGLEDAGSWGDEGIDWTWVADDLGLEVDWTVVASPDLEQAIATFAFRWKEGQAWRPVVAGSWTEGAAGYDLEQSWKKWTWTVPVPELKDDWRILLGVAGTFGK